MAHHFGRARLRGRSISEAGMGRRGRFRGAEAVVGEGELARHFGRARRRGDAVGVAAFQKREGEGGWG